MRTFVHSLGFLKTAMIVGLFALPMMPMMSTTALAADPIKIGLMCPLVGPWASEGQEMQRVVSFLADEVNKKGGIKGTPIELIVEDDAGDPRTAALAAQKLLSAGVIAIIGTYGSAVTEASQGVIDEAGVLQIANGATSIRLTEKGMPLFFRTAPRDDASSVVATKTIKDKGYKRVAVLHDNSSFAKGVAEESLKNLKAAGLEVVFYDALTPNERDYTAIITKIKSSNPDILFYTGYYPEAGTLLRQKAEMNWNVPMLGGDAASNRDLVQIAGKKAAKGFTFVSPPVPSDFKNAEAKAFIKAYSAKYGAAPNSMYSVLAGDGFKVLVEALQNGAPATAKGIAKYLKEDLKDYPALTGSIAFDAKGDRVGDLYHLYVVDGDGNFIMQE